MTVFAGVDSHWCAASSGRGFLVIALSSFRPWTACRGRRAKPKEPIGRGADQTSDRRGWPGDTFADEPWGSKLWLLDRAKLTTDVRNKAVTYAQTALDRHLKPDYAKLVTVTGSIPQFQMLQLDIAITRPDDSELSLSIKQRWEAQANAV